MTIALSKTTIDSSASSGTIVGALTCLGAHGEVVSCTFSLLAGAAGPFGVSESNLVTAWQGTLAAGHYSVNVQGRHADNTTEVGIFEIVVGAAPDVPPGPSVVSISLNPTSASVPDTSPAGTRVTTASVTMSDGSTYAGGLTVSPPGMLSASGMNIETSRALGASDDGSHAFTIAAGSISAAFTMVVTATTTAVPGLVAEWVLDAASVSGSTVADASGEGHSGTIVGGALAFGAMGALFNGTQRVDSTLSVAGAALTVSAWFNSADLNFAYSRIAATGHSDWDNQGFQLQFNKGGANGWFGVGNGSGNVLCRWTEQLVAGRWYHYVGVYDGANAVVYLDGVQKGTVPFTGNVVSPSDNLLSIGRAPPYDGDYFKGAIYDVRVYNEALSANDVGTLFRATTPPVPVAGPTGITLNPASVTLPDTTPAGTVVSTASVTMSDGSQFAGTLTVTGNALFGASGMNVVTTRAMTSADHGAFSLTVTARQNNVEVSVILATDEG